MKRLLLFEIHDPERRARMIRDAVMDYLQFVTTKAKPCAAAIPRSPSLLARRDMLASPYEPLWLCDWREVVFLHFDVDPEILQRQVPFELDLFNGRAFVSLVAFTLADMRPRIGGRLARQLFKPFGTHRFLNVRTYVRHGDHVGIHFLAEWLDAPRLNLIAGPLLYGLPFRFGQIAYTNSGETDAVSGSIQSGERSIHYRGTITAPLQPAEPGSVDEFLVERYRAYTQRGRKRGWFPVWHQPWSIAPVSISDLSADLLTTTGDWWRHANLHSAHWSPTAAGVWMGWRQPASR